MVFKRRLCLLVHLILFSVGCLTGCQQSPIIARVGNFAITAGQFESYLLYNVSNVSLFDTEQERHAHLDHLIEQYLKYIAAMRQGLDRTLEFMTAMPLQEKKAVIQYVRQKEILEKLIPFRDVKIIYDRMGKQVSLQHIFVPFPKNPADSVQIHQSLEEIREQILRGRDFGALARVYSQDSLTKDLGGAMGYVRWGHRGLGDHFYDNIFGLGKKRISPPIKSLSGYHLVQVLGKRAIPKPPLRELQDDIRRYYFSDRLRYFDDFERKAIERIKRNIRLQFEESTLRLLLASIRQIPEPIIATTDEGIQNLPSRILKRSLKLLQVGGVDYTLDDFLREELNKTGMDLSSVADIKTLKDYLKALIPDERWLMWWGYCKGYQKSAFVREQVENRKRALLIRQIERVMIDDRFPELDDLSYEQYYLDHQDSYFFPEARQVQEILVSSRSLAEEIVRRAASESFDDLARQYNERGRTRATLGILGFLAADHEAPIGEQAALLQAGEVTGPIESKLGYSVIRVLAIQPKRQKTFMEAKRQVMQDYHHDIQQALTEQWLEQLRKSTAVQIYEARLKQAFQNQNSGSLDSDWPER